MGGAAVGPVSAQQRMDMEDGEDFAAAETIIFNREGPSQAIKESSSPKTGPGSNWPVALR